MKLNYIYLLAIAALTGCKSHEAASPTIIEAPVVAPAVKALPKATVYRMEGDASPENVPVTISPATGNIVSFPGPRDIVGQEPIALGNGWYLDRRGIGENSRFTRWTYAEYQKLTAVPSTAEIKAAIIPGARPTDIRHLQMTPWEAEADTAAIKKYLGIN